MKTHNIKLDINFCDAVLSGEKNFEIRYDDRNYHKGDMIRFIPLWDGESVPHPIQYKTYEITYVLNGYGLKDGWVVFGIRKVSE